MGGRIDRAVICDTASVQCSATTNSSNRTIPALSSINRVVFSAIPSSSSSSSDSVRIEGLPHVRIEDSATIPFDMAPSHNMLSVIRKSLHQQLKNGYQAPCILASLDVLIPNAMRCDKHFRSKYGHHNCTVIHLLM